MFWFLCLPAFFYFLLFLELVCSLGLLSLSAVLLCWLCLCLPSLSALFSFLYNFFFPFLLLSWILYRILFFCFSIEMGLPSRVIVLIGDILLYPKKWTKYSLAFFEAFLLLSIENRIFASQYLFSQNSGVGATRPSSLQGFNSPDF